MNFESVVATKRVFSRTMAKACHNTMADYFALLLSKTGFGFGLNAKRAVKNRLHR